MPPAAFLHLENAPKSLAAGASPQTPLGELTALPQNPLAGLRGLLLREGKGREERTGEGRRGTLDLHNVGDRLTPLTKGAARRSLIHDSLLVELFDVEYYRDLEIGLEVTGGH